MRPMFNKKLLVVAVASTALLAACGGDTKKTGQGGAKLIRLATTPLGAELTGMEVTENGELFFNVQHPSTSLPLDEGKAAVGAFHGINFNDLPKALVEAEVPDATSPAAKTVQTAPGTSYQVLGREGDDYAGGLPFGLGAIVAADGLSSVKQSNDPDFNGFVPSNAEGTEGFLFTAWEDRPGGMSRLQLSRAGGSWLVEDAMNVDFSLVKGTMINCFGSVSPWGTPLTSEENYEAENTVRWNDSSYTGGYPNYADVQKIQDYLGGTYPNPYDYGYIVEITDPTGTPTPVKHFTLGRMAHENAVIMPDEKTVYLTDDGGNKGFFKFVADTAQDLSSGTLYAAKLVQDGDVDADSSTTGFDITWIELGSSNNTDIETFVDGYDGIDESDFVDVNNTSYVTDAEIAAYAAGTGDVEIAFVETLRAAEAMGATVEFNKMEGIRINYAGAASGDVPYMYAAMADVTGAMSDSTGDIAITANRCGIVYRFELDSEFNVDRMEPVLAGGPYDSGAATDECDVNNIAQPDNVFVLNNGHVLIGEDSGNHENNMLWLFNPKGK